MNKIIHLYKSAYGGLSPSAWMLAVVMLINRSGSMVMPFLSIYLTKDLGYDLERAGIILAIFGGGAMAGSLLGGWLTDKLGHFKVQFISLTLGGLMIFVLSYIKTFELLAVYVFLVSLIVESLRPANATSVAMYSKPENITRAFSLNRMAVNLGFSVGPAIGGFLAAYSYYWLFLVDGTTCILAGFMFFFYFRNKKSNPEQAIVNTTLDLPAPSVWKDGSFILFCICVILFATSFFQLFFTLPLYYREVYNLSENNIGILLALNGLVVFVFEMIIIYQIGNKIEGKYLIILGCLLTGLAYVILNLFTSNIILYVSVLVVSFGEIFAMPYMITYTTERSGANNKGAYMGFYALTFSTAFVIAPLLGTRIVSFYNYELLWWIIGGLTTISSIGFYFIINNNKNPQLPLVDPIALH